MAGNTFGEVFRVTSWGESHGPAIGVTIDGCPAGLAISQDDFRHDLERRRPGQSEFTTQRKEDDNVEILAGVYEGHSTGTPIQLLIPNNDQHSKDYSKIAEIYRPSHADYTYEVKYGNRDPRGGGRSSARITAGIVAAGVIAKRIIQPMVPTAYVVGVGAEEASIVHPVTEADVERSPIRCPDLKASERMESIIREARMNRDSVGGIIECVVDNMPPGLGEPIFDKLDALMAYAMLGIPAVKAFEIGSGFAGTKLHGSEHNDPFSLDDRGKIITLSNNSGGIQGGISNGMPIVMRVGFKPTATIGYEQQTVTVQNELTTIATSGRHDPCVVPRAVPIVEAYAACVLADLSLRNLASRI